jgi:glycosyltransferase involved in cell wall biosynthesis
VSSKELACGAAHVVWVYTEPAIQRLDAATWLETTRELRNSGWRVTLVAEGPAGERRIRGVEVLCIAKPRVYLLRQAVFHFRVLRLLASERSTIKVILFHSMSAPWLLPLRFVRRLTQGRYPILVMDSRTVPMAPVKLSLWRDQLRALYDRLMHRLANRWADGQTTITQRMAETLCIPSHQLWCSWPSGVDPARFLCARTGRQWPLPGERIRLVYVGVLHYERNLMSLCRAVERANSEGMRFAVSLVGDGTERPALEKFSVRTEGRVCVLSPVPHERVPALLGQAHVGVLPFPDEEKFRVSSPIKLFEYLAAGMPILATRIACHTDVTGSGEYVFWAEDASIEGLLEALRVIWRASASLRRLGDEAAAAAQAWTWQESAAKLSDALQHAIRARDDSCANDSRIGASSDHGIRTRP